MQENYSYWLVTKLKEKLGLKTDSDIAEKIDGLNQGNVAHIKAGRRHLTPEQALYIAQECNLDVGEVLVRLDMEKTKSEAVRVALGGVLKRIAGAVAGIVLIMGLMTTPASDDSLAVS
ncbi:hypothetical protein [Arsukibacterium indicum]|uniref:HTH cro/C1-type domain-containing protein n=1 Tax=Arsukibacterium indicum TaxID=2848612 RepID=A0ABS6MM50_9GAMM|nr:hypothetical protein [Arsukibacterium indicum]MBV2129878.1 hypothetical protein [Arsukibacterium indicum]